MRIQDLHSLYLEHYLVDTDTRKIREKSIFFALKGDNFNGNHYALDALQKGANYAVVDEYDGVDHRQIIVVENVLETLQNLANYHRNYLGIPIISLTGSNGKTTTKELITTVLSKKYNVSSTHGNFNNHIGVPLTLLAMDNNTEIGVVEMGANHHKEIALLSKISNPDYGYITNFGKAHIEGFGSLEGVIEAKSELYDYIIANNKKVFINRNDAIQLKKTVDADRIFIDESILLDEVNPFVKLIYNNFRIQSRLIGIYNFNNIAAAISIGIHFDVEFKDIKEAIENYTPNNNRSQIIVKENNKILLDAYNANPTSMKAALDNFKKYPEENKIIILGDMFELGQSSLNEHQEIVNFATDSDFIQMFFIGESFYKTQTSLPKFKNFGDFKLYFEKLSYKNHTFLIKGSRGMSLERILEYIN